jgi:hypothetical protein
VIAGLAGIAILGTLCCGGWCIVVDKPWQLIQVDKPWCREQASAGEPIIAALEDHRIETGSYPDTIDDLVPRFLDSIPPTIPHPSGNGGDGWGYRKINDNEYVLFVTALHWVSSFDVLVYRSTGQYPRSWIGHRYSRKIDGWRYIIGAQRMEPWY